MNCLILVKTWLSILERTGIVYLLQPYSASVLTRAIKAPKVYFKDTGLACYLSRWLSADALKNSAVAGNMFETFIVSEILKSYTNEGKDYRFQIFYYRGKDKKASIENEIDLIIEENGIIYPVEIKMTGKPKASMASANTVLDRITTKIALGYTLDEIPNAVTGKTTACFEPTCNSKPSRRIVSMSTER